MKAGQSVTFGMYDNLFKDVVIGTGVLVSNIYGKLWRIRPNKSKRLSGGVVQIHEHNIREKP